jgi:UDP-N-acetylmuramoylalanine--D-glutamate ligase
VLPHRLQSLGARDAELPTTTAPPKASIAADRHGAAIAIPVGGYDRGLDWGAFAERMVLDPPKR